MADNWFEQNKPKAEQPKPPPAPTPTPAPKGNWFSQNAPQTTRPPTPPPTPAVPSFPINKHINEQLKTVPPEKHAETRNSLASVFGYIARPFIVQGYEAGAAFNRGTAEIMENLDTMTKWMVKNHPSLKREGLFENLAKAFENNAQYYSEQAQKYGIGYVDKLVGDAVGGTAPGMADFLLKVDSGYVIPAVVGAEKAKEARTSPMVGALVEAGKTAVLHHVLRMAEPYSRFVKATIQGATFGVQGATEAPKGKKFESFVSGAAVGAAFGVISPGGYGWKDVYSNIGKSVPEIRAELDAAQETQPKTAGLRPAIKVGDQVIEGKPGENHPDIVNREGITETAPAAKPAEKPEQKPTRQVKATPTGGAAQDSWTLQTEGGNMDIVFANGRVRVVGVRVEDESQRQGVATDLYRHLGKMMKERGIPRNAIDSDVEGPKEAMDKLHKIAGDIAGEGGEGVDRYDIDDQPAAEPPEEFVPSDENWAQAMQEVAKPGEIAETERGFVDPDGNYLSREEAKDWVKENEPEVYGRWASTKDDQGAEFHSEDYTAAKSVGAAGAGDIHDDDLGQLTEILHDMPESADLKQRIAAAEKEARGHTEGPLAKAKTAWAKIKAIGTALHEWYKAPPDGSPFKVQWNRYLGDRQIAGLRIEKFAKEMTEKIPVDRREAITKYVRTGGDMDELKRQADSATDPKIAKRYRDAMSLTPEEARLAQNIRYWYDSMFEKAQKAGVLKSFIENYVNRIYRKRPGDITKDAGAQLVSETNAGMLDKNPSFAKKRFYQHDWDAESKGAELEDDIGKLISIYERSFDEAIAARRFMVKLADMQASDGWPLTAMWGSGKQLGPDENVPDAFLIKPRTPPKAREIQYKEGGTEYPSEVTFNDYVKIDHPAFRGHKWVGKDSDGKPIFLDADMKVHPEIAKDLEAGLMKSKFETGKGAWKLGKALLRASAEVKGTILSASLFHQVGIAYEAITHGSSPFSPAEIDLNDPVTRELIRHGVHLYDGNGLTEFMEGAKGPGLWKFLPKIGEYVEQYSEYLFRAPDGYIPRMKVQIAKQVLERNLKRYPELSRDQVLFRTAEQANAITGGQNYKAMGRSATMQDLFRLGGLAPDFLEARFRRGLQAIKPGGQEQAVAIVRSAIGMYVAAKIIEGAFTMIDPDKNKVHLDRPFSVSVDDKEYSLKSWVGDFYHMFSDPRSFVYHRLNPLIRTPLTYAFTGRDQFGNVKSFADTAKDYLKGFSPIIGQGFFQKKDFTIWQSIMQTLGISSWNYSSDAEHKEREIQQMKSPKVPIPEETKERREKKSELTTNLVKELKAGKSREEAMKPINDAVKAGEITRKDAESIKKTAKEGRLAEGLTDMTFPEAYEVWKKADDDEKSQIARELKQKFLTFYVNSTPAEREAFTKQGNEIMNYKPKGKPKRFSVRQQ